MKNKYQEMAGEFEGIFRQKMELGLFNQPSDRLAAMKTLNIDPDIHSAQFIIFLVDFNPYSGLFERTKDKLTSLPFASQVRIFHGGFAMWEQGLNRLGE
jgi:hypothetical protein